jgi:hypothetical protein
MNFFTLKAVSKEALLMPALMKQDRGIDDEISEYLDYILGR